MSVDRYSEWARSSCGRGVGHKVQSVCYSSNLRHARTRGALFASAAAAWPAVGAATCRCAGLQMGAGQGLSDLSCPLRCGPRNTVDGTHTAQQQARECAASGGALLWGKGCSSCLPRPP